MNAHVSDIGDNRERPAMRPDLDAWGDALRAAEHRRPWNGGAAHGAPPSGLWATTLQWPLAAAVVVALAALTYTRNGWIPLLSGADLGVHEFGHLVFVWSPTIWEQFAGSFMQVALPLVVAACFWRRRDAFATIVTLAWAAESLNNVSVYVYDATRMVLPLFNDDGSGAGHDWHNILGELGLLGSTDQLAYLVRALSVALFVAALALAVRGFVRARRAA
jgi:hypothetical protein